MLLTSIEFTDSGLPTSSDISGPEIDMAIKTVEMQYLKSRLGSEKYIELNGPLTEFDETLLNGGELTSNNTTHYIAGIKFGLVHAVYAYLLFDRVRLTRYGSDVKDSGESHKPTDEELMNIVRVHWEIFESTIQEITTLLNIKPENYNNIFDTLLY